MGNVRSVKCDDGCGKGQGGHRGGKSGGRGGNGEGRIMGSEVSRGQWARRVLSGRSEVERYLEGQNI